MASGIIEGTQPASSTAEQTPQSISRSRLVQRLLAAGSDLPAFVRDLLTTQAVVVVGTEAAGFLIEMVQAEAAAEGAPAKPAEMRLQLIEHIRPDQSTPDVRSAAIQAFADIVKPCIVQNKDGAIEIGVDKPQDTVEPQFCLVTLLRADNRVVAVSAVITRCRDKERAQQRLQSMQLVAGYFELFTIRKGTEQAREMASTHQYVLQLATSVSTAENFAASAMNLANELATRTNAARVSIGWLKGTRIKLKAISHSEEFDRKQELSVQLERTMEECVDQGELVQFDPNGEGSPNVTREAQALSRMAGGGAVISLPLHRGSEVQGVVTLEFPAQRPLDPRSATALAVAAELIAPQLYDRYQNDRWLITKAGISTRETAKLAMGPKHMLAKSIISLVLATLLVICVYKPMYHVTAPFTFEAVDKRTLCAPFDGYISEVKYNAGDKVHAGDTLLVMDTKDVLIEKLRYEAEAAAKFDEAQKDLADPTKHADYKQAMQDRAVALAEVQLRQSRIDRSIITAPYSGVVLSGDWRDKVGSPVKQGDVLYDMSERGLRAELSVAERDIQWLHASEPGEPAQTGELATTSLPTERIAFKIDGIVPQGTPKEGENVFSVYATPDTANDQWKPGMEGEAKVNVEPRPVIWIWTHRLIEFIRIKLWI
jgi:biotin carboxyl carrier protein